MDFNNCTPHQWVENEDACLKQLQDETVWNNIPLLNVNELQQLKDSTLVRFRGMVQDMHSPEYYLEKFEIHNKKTNQTFFKNGKYCDAAITNPDEFVNDGDSNKTAERQTYVVISVPGVNDWVQELEEKQFKVVENKLLIEIKHAKRTHDEAMDFDDIALPSTSSCRDEKNKIFKKNDHLIEDKPQVVSKEYILNNPLPDRTGKSCHVKVYEHQNDLKLNETYEFVGFLGMDPLTEAAYEDVGFLGMDPLTEAAYEDDINSKIEMEILHPPSSLVPRIHCVTLKKLKHNNPLLTNENDSMDCDKINVIRKELLIVLTQILLGDELAAEYLIFHLISEVYLRRDFMLLGKFSLNISSIPTLENIDYACELYKFIETFVPKSYYLPMTLENMNALSFTPKKDYECNRLTSGILQLTTNTHIVLDETKLSSGKLNAAGVNNMKAVANAIKNQTVSYDFHYYPLEFHCDIPFLILSEGKSILNADSHVVLKPELICVETFQEILAAAKHFLKPELLNDIRKYLTYTRMTKYEISENVEGLVQNEFVDMMQRGTVSENDLHSLLVLARLVSISHGKSRLDEECWKKACSLENERKSRL